jgi:CRISPR-associated protein Csy1
MTSPPQDQHPDTIRQTILTFLQERLQEKLDKLKDDEEAKKEDLIASYQLKTWVSDAARRVTQIQQVTHALKFIHPDAKGTNLFNNGNPDAGPLRIGTHTLPRKTPDVVGNAAALDVNKFLRLEVGGQSLLALAIEKSVALQHALSENDVEAKTWMAKFASIVDTPDTPSSHKNAKQLYWPVGDNDYHVLAPLFPTSLVHHVWREINDAYFSEDAKEARQAHKNDKPHTHGYVRYPGIVVQSFGGTKPQNISQLNSERGGKSYLLSSVPPKWKSQVNLPMKKESIFDGWFPNRPEIKNLTKSLREFLYRVQDHNNVRIRDTRKAFVDQIIDELLAVAAELRNKEESWTEHASCKLNESQKLWLNPYRCQHDEAFNKQYQLGYWKEDICRHFSLWLNVVINDKEKPLPFDDATATEWHSNLNDALRLLALEVAAYD